jgi:peptidase S49-like protein
VPPNPSMTSAHWQRLRKPAAAKIYVPEFTGGVGSVGVYAEHVDWSEYNRKLGVKVTYIAEGEGKTDGNPNEPLSDAARSALGAEVSRLYGLFASAVARGRGLTEDVLSLPASGASPGTYLAHQFKTAGVSQRTRPSTRAGQPLPRGRRRSHHRDTLPCLHRRVSYPTRKAEPAADSPPNHHEI